jgi:hypothetical protein
MNYQVVFKLAKWLLRRRLKTYNIRFDTFGPLVSFVYFRSTRKTKFFRGPSHEYSYQTFVLIGPMFSEKNIKM